MKFNYILFQTLFCLFYLKIRKMKETLVMRKEFHWIIYHNNCAKDFSTVYIVLCAKHEMTVKIQCVKVINHSKTFFKWYTI